MSRRNESARDCNGGGLLPSLALVPRAEVPVQVGYILWQIYGTRGLGKVRFMTTLVVAIRKIIANMGLIS